MSSFFRSSIGKKVIMSLSGLFLIVFLLVHLVANLMLLVGPDAFNAAAHFMGHNPVIKIMEPFLAIGLLFHILYSMMLSMKNMRTRPVGYQVRTSGLSSSWSSRNMFILGTIIFLALVIHIINYYWKFKFTDILSEGKTTEYDIVVALFTPEKWFYAGIYIVWFIFLGLHLNHALQSALHTLGLNNSNWACRLKLVSSLYSILITVGFAIIPVYFLVKAIF